MILADDLGSADLSCYGSSDIRTPNIDALARTGVKLTQCYANPECTPTRAALLTGRYAQRFGGLECAIGLNNVGRYDEAEALAKRGELGLPADAASMANVFKANGYETAIFGKWHLGYEAKFAPSRHGFDQHFGIIGGGADYYTHREPEPNGRPAMVENGHPVERSGYLTDLFADAALDWLEHRPATGKPFFLYLPFNAPHTPIQDPDIPDDPGKNGDRARYVRMVERMDRRVGDILAQLDANNTLVLFLSDNGADANGSNAPLRGRKSSVYEGGTRVAGLIRWTGKLKPRESDQVTHVIDILPTLASACELRLPARPALDGMNLWPVWQGKKKSVPRTLFWRYRRGANTRKAIRDGRWKLTNDSGDESLFDLTRDPREQTPLQDREPATAASLRAKLAAWESEFRPRPL